jgi:hypothetical protein
MIVPAVAVLVVVSCVPMPIVTVSAVAGCASIRLANIAAESAGKWRTILILMWLDVLTLS